MNGKDGKVRKGGVLDLKGKVVYADDQVCTRWKEYFETLLNIEGGTDAQIGHTQFEGAFEENVL